MKSFLLLATAWGPKFGGINAFNMDFAKGLSLFLGDRGKVFCSVLDATSEEIKNAKGACIELIPINKPQDIDQYDPSWAHDVIEFLDRKFPGTNIDYWIGHDVVSGEAAKKGASFFDNSRSALIMHMNYEAYQGYKKGVGQKAKVKSLEQKRVFQDSDFLYANGPSLEAALSDLIGRDVVQLVPGFADIDPSPSKAELVTITFGRMDRESDRIKQGGLAVAGFGSAIKYANNAPEGRGLLTESPMIKVVGIKDPGGKDEKALRELVSQRAGRVVNILATKYDEDRKALFDELGRANIALMLSWHEGFGLTGWEAIAGEVPLILSKRTGLAQRGGSVFGQVVKHIAFRRDCEAVERFERAGTNAIIGVFDFQYRPRQTIGVEGLEPVDHALRIFQELALSHAIGFRHGEAVGIAEHPIQPLIRCQPLRKRDHEPRGPGDQRGEKRMEKSARLFNGG